MEDSVVSRMEKHTCHYQESIGYYRFEGVAIFIVLYLCTYMATVLII